MSQPNANAKLQEEIKRYVQAHRDAQSALKECELVRADGNDGLIVPSLNEFRSVAEHIEYYFSADRVEQAEDELAEMVTHLRRAAYDAYQAQIQFYLRKCQDFDNDYRQICIVEILGTFVADRQVAQGIIKEISAEKRDDLNNRGKYAEQKKEQLAKLKDINERWEIARQELNKKIAADDRQRAGDKKERKRSKIQFWLMLAITAASVIVAVCK
ncbi:hypothetical protein FACS1894107_07110 [Planctomycetales bacterium]|nr:hypothetical protein FACS1894107_07110 [Planctomycetales bacterium]